MTFCSRQECLFLQGRGSVRHSERWALIYAARLSRNNRSPLSSSSLSFAYLEPLLFSLLSIYGPARSGNRTTPCESGSCLFWNAGSGRNVQLSVQREHAVMESWSIHTSISGNESGVSRPARWRLERSECNSAGKAVSTFNNNETYDPAAATRFRFILFRAMSRV